MRWTKTTLENRSTFISEAIDVKGERFFMKYDISGNKHLIALDIQAICAL